MKKAAIITAIVLIVVGLTLSVGAIVSVGFDFSKLNTVKYHEATYEINEPFSNIKIDTNVADIELVPSENGECKVVCTETEKVTYSTAVTGDTLNITSEDGRKWYDFIGIAFSKMNVTVYLPENEYSTLKIDTDTGRIKVVSEFSFADVTAESDTGSIIWESDVEGSLDISTDTGSISVSDTNAGYVTMETDTGSIKLKNARVTNKVFAEAETGSVRFTDVNAETISASVSTGVIVMNNSVCEKLTAKNHTGDIVFESADAKSIDADTSTGDIRGTLKRDMIFSANSSLGKVRVPSSSEGGYCELSTNTGDIVIEIE